MLELLVQWLALCGAAATPLPSPAQTPNAIIVCTMPSQAARVEVSVEGAVRVFTPVEGYTEFAPVSQKPLSEDSMQLTGFSRARWEHVLLTVTRPHGRSLLQAYGTSWDLNCRKK